MKIKKFENDLMMEKRENIKNIILSLSALLSIGLSNAQVINIKNDPHKMSVVDTLIKYNKNPLGINKLDLLLKPKLKNSDEFIKDYLKILPDKTIVIKPSFIRGLELNLNRNEKTLGVNYKINM